MAGKALFERATIGGMDVLLAPRPGSGLVAATAVIRRGSVDESPSETGLASFTSAMLMRGTAWRSSEQMAFDLETLGAIAGTSDGMDTTGMSVRCARTEASAALEILFEALRGPAFDGREHEVNRQEVLADLRMVEDDKFGFTYREYLKTIFDGHGYGHPSEGEIPDVEKITPEDCRRWHAGMIRPESILFVAVGDFDTARWRGMLEGLTAGWGERGQTIRSRQQGEPPARSLDETVIEKPDLKQGFIVMGYRTPTVMHADYPALRLASAALGEGFGGRIFTNLRDNKSLAYALGSTLRTYRLGGHQVLYIGTKPETIAEARAGLLEEAGWVRENLERARQHVIGKYLMSHQSLAQRAGFLAYWADMAGDPSLDGVWPERLAAVTAQEVRAAAERWWIDPVIVTLRPQAAGA